MIISTMLYPSKEDPFNNPLVLAEYAKSDGWVAIHLGQFAGGVIVFIGGFGTLYRLLSHSNSSMVSALSWLGFAVAIMASSAIAILQAIDGIALKFAVDVWTANTSYEDKKTIFRVAEGIRWIEYGINSIFRILQGVVSIIFGSAITKSMLVNRWTGIAGIIIGAITIAAGVEVAYLAFPYANIAGLRGLSMIIFIVWVGTLGGFMLRKSMAKKEVKEIE